ncbi:MAG: HEAT repeat domain-containing protein [Microlunatus sp.]|nr:HEAT repeat domain-containing protein [Microlunatus sp.]
MALDPREHPREHWAAMQRRYGAAQVTEWCADLITGRIATRADHPAVDMLSTGSHIQRIRSGVSPDYWVRAWAARALLYVWEDDAAPAVVTGLSDQHWRVRELCAKVCRVRDLGAAADRLAVLVTDQTPRVRVAAIKALAQVGEAEHADAVRAALDDPDPAVVGAAEIALPAMSERLDRDLGGPT